MQPTKELAELVGILLGDGSLSIYKSPVYSTYYAIKITTHSDDLEYIDYICELFKHLLNVNPIVKKRPNENTRDIFVFKKHIVLFFIGLGLKKSPKWEHALIPEQFITYQLGKFVLRGYFDTDGSVVITDNNGSTYPRLEMKISPALMQNQFIKLRDLYRIRHKSYNISKEKVRIQINGRKELEKWMKFIGFSNPKHRNKASLFIPCPA